MSSIFETRTIPMEVEAGVHPFDSFYEEDDEFGDSGFPFLRFPSWYSRRRPQNHFGSSRFEQFGFPFYKNIPFERQEQQVNAEPDTTQEQSEKEATSEHSCKNVQPEQDTERVIPINVERSDKHTSSSESQPEVIFRRRPTKSTQFVGQKSQEFKNTTCEKPPQLASTAQPKPQQETHKSTPQQDQEQISHHQQTTKPQQESPTHAKQQQQTPISTAEQAQKQIPHQQQTAKPPSTPIDLIQSIQSDVSDLKLQVEHFNGVANDKKYLYLDEMLTRNLIKLDNIDTEGQETVRQARKEAIKTIENCINILEEKAAANAALKESQALQEEKMEADESKSRGVTIGDEEEMKEEK